MNSFFKIFLGTIIIFGGILLFVLNPDLLSFESPKSVAEEEVLRIHAESGLIDDEGLQMVLIHCTGCHSAKLISQNRATEDGWISMIRWMQATQGLWPLGENEKTIVQYLAKNYAPQKIGRRSNLENIEWYSLEQ